MTPVESGCVYEGRIISFKRCTYQPIRETLQRKYLPSGDWHSYGLLLSMERFTVGGSTFDCFEVDRIGHHDNRYNNQLVELYWPGIPVGSESLYLLGGVDVSIKLGSANQCTARVHTQKVELAQQMRKVKRGTTTQSTPTYRAPRRHGGSYGRIMHDIHEATILSVQSCPITQRFAEVLDREALTTDKW